MSTQQPTDSLSSKPTIPTWVWVVLGAVVGGVLAGVVGWHEIARAADADPDWGGGIAMLVLYALEAVIVVVGVVLGGGITAWVLWLRRRSLGAAGKTCAR
ncbi:hypothetical protein [Prosthecobacter sp.]|uniref:hypothetical protein n=1 Tax=Prosthecobacter sp. TaxID=1965333 RepID=UPI002AB99EB0|nr:hypothetical protein [Prosthecobacter sp.]MDZ4404739.1 hypothetical protein [Prosthecobacter sp.]